ncbi:MAG: J domain-containing protein [Fimbriiglobus sp.]|jgi:curved DNA-binding protein CbpA|nr:J domain-containing protein [Fimbriiglobus sp.]
MPDPYTVLELTPDADDATVRKRYLEFTLRYTPEQHPEKFAAVRAAYEKLRTLDARVKYKLFEQGSENTIEAIIEEAECTTPRPRPSLDQLTAATTPAKPGT